MFWGLNLIIYVNGVTVGPSAAYLVKTETVLFDFCKRENKIHCPLLHKPCKVKPQGLM